MDVEDELFLRALAYRSEHLLKVLSNEKRWCGL